MKSTQLCLQIVCMKISLKIKSLHPQKKINLIPWYFRENFLLNPSACHATVIRLAKSVIPGSRPKGILGVKPPSPTGKNWHRLHSLQVKSHSTCNGRSWNPTTERPERQLHSSAAMLRFDHFRRPNHREIVSHLWFLSEARLNHHSFMMPVRGLLQW